MTRAVVEAKANLPQSWINMNRVIGTQILPQLLLKQRKYGLIFPPGGPSQYLCDTSVLTHYSKLDTSSDPAFSSFSFTRPQENVLVGVSVYTNAQPYPVSYIKPPDTRDRARYIHNIAINDGITIESISPWDCHTESAIASTVKPSETNGIFSEFTWSIDPDAVNPDRLPLSSMRFDVYKDGEYAFITYTIERSGETRVERNGNITLLEEFPDDTAMLEIVDNKRIQYSISQKEFAQRIEDRAKLSQFAAIIPQLK